MYIRIAASRSLFFCAMAVLLPSSAAGIADSYALMAAWYVANSTGGLGKIAALSDKPFSEPWRRGLTPSSGILANPINARIFVTLVVVVSCYSFRLETLPPREFKRGRLRLD